MPLNVKFTFDENSYRHYMNGFLSVLHCHHYLCLTTRMAEDFNDIGGCKILRESAEDSFRPLLDDYFKKNNVIAIQDKMRVGSEYYSVMGLGKMQIKANEKGGVVHLTKSHLDEGWIKKWGTHNKPINYFSCGVIAAIFAAAFNKPPRSFDVTESESIVKGHHISIFLVHSL